MPIPAIPGAAALGEADVPMPGIEAELPAGEGAPAAVVLEEEQAAAVAVSAAVISAAQVRRAA
ncbi:hypothetical protein [Actinocrinis sp.]|uniref:hypothetical protein n=1 Tax=Actinocrinis sp. TaxID=1920516 RepID=UPI002D4BAD92|nr:hypothetical protein [Actinocrinis sp.]HZP50145.1 hypothetical protein [Actinocrinis sp.]